MTEEDRVRLRHTDRWVGAIVLVALAVFLFAAFQRSVLSQFFAGGSELTVLMPEEVGLAGLAEGTEVEVLGIRIGTVRDIIVGPEGRIRAELRVDDQAKVFLRTDSVATVRRRFGIAGPAFLDISRGQAAPLSWGRDPVIEARVEEAATASAGALLEDLRNRVIPVFDDLQRGTRAFAEAAERLNRGEGTVGRLLTDDTIARQAEDAATRATAILGTLGAAAEEVKQLTASLTGSGNGEGDAEAALPALLRRAERALAALERASADIAQASPAVPRIARNIERATQPLPAVTVQVQQTARELELLLGQLRGHWLLGGENGPTPRDRLRPSADRVRP